MFRFYTLLYKPLRISWSEKLLRRHAPASRSGPKIDFSLFRNKNSGFSKKLFELKKNCSTVQRLIVPFSDLLFSMTVSTMCSHVKITSGHIKQKNPTKNMRTIWRILQKFVSANFLTLENLLKLFIVSHMQGLSWEFETASANQ